MRAGDLETLDEMEVRERYQQLSDASHQLLGDFRGVKQNFRELDRHLRERIAGWEGGKGDLVGSSSATATRSPNPTRAEASGPSTTS
ncbi:hypothetical protein GCM10029992_07370 [Glycomyces albus]